MAVFDYLDFFAIGTRRLWVRGVFLLCCAGAGVAQGRTDLLEIENSTPISLRQYIDSFTSQELTETRMRYDLLVEIDQRLDLKLSVPSVLHRRIRQVLNEINGHDRNVDIYGMGDVSLAARWTLLRRAARPRQRWAITGEVIFPTGVDDKEEFSVRIARRLQLGMGAFGLKGGIANALERGRHRLASSMYYLHWTRHEGIRLGPSLNFDAAYSFRLLPIQPDPSQESLLLRAGLRVSSKYRWSSLDSSGHWLKDEGPEIWLGPTLEIHPSRGLRIEASLRLPVCQDLEDDLGERRWGASLGLHFDF